MNENLLIWRFIQDHSIRNYMMINGIKYYLDDELSRKKTILCWISVISFILPLFIYYFIFPNYFNIHSLPLSVSMFIIFILVTLFSMIYLIIARRIAGNNISGHLIKDPNQS